MATEVRFVKAPLGRTLLRFSACGLVFYWSIIAYFGQLSDRLQSGQPSCVSVNMLSLKRDLLGTLHTAHCTWSHQIASLYVGQSGHCLHCVRSEQSDTDLPSPLVYPVDCWVFLTPSTGLQGGRTFLLVLKKIHFWY